MWDACCTQRPVLSTLGGRERKKKGKPEQCVRSPFTYVGPEEGDVSVYVCVHTHTLPL